MLEPVGRHEAARLFRRPALHTGHQKPSRVAEMSLWTPWLHIGDLTTLDVSGVIVLDVSGFADTLCRSSESLLKAQEYAQQLAQLMNQEGAVTDLWQCQVGPVLLSHGRARPKAPDEA